jgi:transposase
MFYLGVDVAKEKFDVCLLHGDQRWSGTFSNDAAGFAKLDVWLVKRADGQVQACMEATGRYGENLAAHLHEAGHRVSIVNPARIKHYAKSQMRRNKTDKIDAAIIADFCRTQTTHEWHPPNEAERTLVQLVRRYDNLVADQTREKNRLKAGELAEAVQASIEAHLTFLNEQIETVYTQIQEHIDQHPELKSKRTLLESIPGIGKKTAAILLAEMPNPHQLSAKQVAAFAGLTPEQLASGQYRRRQDTLSKLGSVTLRTALYMPALAAMRFNPLTEALAQRLQQKGKLPMTIIAAVMRKLLVIAYGVLKSGKPFDPLFASKSPITS